MVSPLQLLKTSGDAVPDTYIIKLKDHVSKAEHHDLLRSEKPHILPSIQVDLNPEILNAYVAVLNADELSFLLNSDHVERIEEDYYIPFPTDLEEPSVINEPEADETHGANGTDEQVNLDAGRNVDIYVVDSGVNIYHKCFGDRARYGKNCTNESENKDTLGHGTHVAGIAAGNDKNYGQASAANVISVKVVVGEAGRGSWLLDGITWAYDQASKSPLPSVINISIGGPKSKSIDEVVVKAIKGGVTVVVAAGNDNKDCKDDSPAGVNEAIVVGAVDNNNRKRPLSNYGATLKAWAPGTDVLSAWIGSNTATARRSGTSQAAPCVAGYVAIVLGKSRKAIAPTDITKQLQAHAKAVVTGVPAGTTNLLAERW